MATELKAVLNLDAKPFIASLQRIGVLTDEQAKKLSKGFEDIKVDADTKPAEQAFENVRKKAEQEGEKAGSGFSTAFSAGIGGAIGSIAANIGGELFAGLGEVLSNVQGFETGVQSLSAVTGATGATLDDLAQRARNLATQFGGNANEQLTVFQTTLSKIGPQLAESPEALGKFAENVNILGKTDAALGAAGAVDALTSSLLQFGVNVNDSAEVAEQSSRFINVLAASAAVGSASVADVAAAVGVVGATAKNANVSFEETNAALQVLASKSLVGSQAGTALTSVLVKLQAQSKDGDDALKALGTSSAELGQLLNTQGIGAAVARLRTAMEGLGTQAEKNALLNKLFGEGGQNAAAALLSGGDMLTQFTEGVTGTNAALDQAEINMNTFAERLSRVKAQIGDAFIGAFQAIAPILNQVMDDIIPALSAALTNAFQALAPTFKVIGAIIGGVIVGAITIFVGVLEKVGEILKFIEPVVPIIAAAFAAYAIATNAAAIASAAAAAKQAILNAVMAANPIGLVITAVAALAVGLVALTDALTVTAAEQLESAEAAKKNLEAQKQQNLEQQKSVRGTQTMVEEFKKLANQASRTKEEEARLQEIQGELDKQYPSLIDQTKSFKENLAGVDEIGSRASKELKGLSDEAKALDKAMAATNKTIAGLQRNVALEELQDSFGSLNLLGRKSENDFRRELQKRVDIFQNQLFNAANDNDVKKAQAQLLDFLNLEGSKLNDGKQLEDIIGKVVNASNKSIAALKVWRNEVEKPVDVPDTPAVPVDPDTKAKEEAAVSILKAKQDEFAIVKQTLEQEAKRLENELLLQALADGGRTKLSELEKNQLLTRQLEIQKQIEAQYRKIFGIADGANVVANLSFKTVEGEDPKKVLADVNGQLLQLQNAVIKANIDLIINGQFDPAELLKSVKGNIDGVKSLIKGNIDKLIEGSIDLDTFRAIGENAVKTLEQNIAVLQEKLDTANIDEKQRTALTEQIAALKKFSEELQQQITDGIIKAGEQQAKAQIDANKRRIELLKEDEEANAALIRALLEENLALETNMKLAAIKTTGEAREAETELILREASAQAAAIAKKYGEAQSFVEKAADKISQSLINALQGPSAEDLAKRDEAIRKIEEEEKALTQSMKKGETDIQSFQSSMDELRRRRDELGGGESLAERLLGATKKASFALAIDKFAEFKNKALKELQDLASQGEVAFDTLGAAIGFTFGEQLVQSLAAGQVTFASLLTNLGSAVLDALSMLAPAISAQYLAFLGPFALPAALVAIAGLRAALSAATSNIGAEEGVDYLTKNYKGRRGPNDNINVWLAEGEGVANRRANMKNQGLIDFINKGGHYKDLALREASREELMKALDLKGMGITFSGLDKLEIKADIRNNTIVLDTRSLERKMEGMERELKQLRQIVANKETDIHVYTKEAPKPQTLTIGNMGF